MLNEGHLGKVMQKKNQKRTKAVSQTREPKARKGKGSPKSENQEPASVTEKGGPDQGVTGKENH